MDENQNNLDTDLPSKFEKDCVTHLHPNSTPFLTPPSDYLQFSPKSYQFSYDRNVCKSEPTSVVRSTYSNPSQNSIHKLNIGVMDGRVQTSTSLQESFNCVSVSSYDSIEEEMARVCGERVDNSGNIDELNRPAPSAYIYEMKFSEGIKLAIPYTQPPNKHVDWRLLRIKHEAELEEKLKRIEKIGGLEKRARLQRRFIQLFGEDTAYSKKEREEVTALTVKYLMPFYKKQKIASRDLFKKVAKHISGSLLERPNLPGNFIILLGKP